MMKSVLKSCRQMRKNPKLAALVLIPTIAMFVIAAPLWRASVVAIYRLATGDFTY